MAPPPPPSDVNHLSHPWDFNDSYPERKSRLLKWLNKLFKSGSGGRRGGSYNPQFAGEENMVVRPPVRMQDDRPRKKKEQEELDHAIALSLSEGMGKPNGYNECRRDNNYGGALLRGADNGGLNPSKYPPCGTLQYHPAGYRVCAGCHREIGCGNYLGCMGSFFHPNCFRCRSCGYPITEHEFSLSGRDPYHKTCFKELTHPKCDVCFQFIPTNAFGLIEYRCHPFWPQKYCPSHEHDNTARCCSCERLEMAGVCAWNAWNLQSWTLVIASLFTMPLGTIMKDMKLDQQIPMLLVERQALNEAIVGEKNGYHHMPETRGLYLSEEQTVTSRPRIGGRHLNGMRTQPQKLTRKCEVTAILVLYGLPRLLTGVILTHELMRGWLRLKGYRNLNPEVEEGICQVLSYMWLESEVLPSSSSRASTSAASSSSSSSKKGGKSNVENKLGEFFIHQIAHDASPVYGGGFRAANAAVNKYGLRRTLDHIHLTGNFPL
ncbi:Protein DA1-related 2 [Hibiscus syriacus]|uniref:Protein DA1-related 2 n=1 Tax=Hibiscus syriacus TaxID=106335 RepID=A0A6A2Y0X9_HIBSY|nr:Protein DA1-related 2 [Hibiscus syriacus]